MSRLLNTLLDDAADAALAMLAEGGSVHSSMVMLVDDPSQSGGDSAGDLGVMVSRTRALVEQLSSSLTLSGALAASLRSRVSLADPAAYGYIAPAWVPDRAAARHEAVHVSAIDRAGHRMSRTYRITRDADGRPSLALVPELSGLSLLGDLATTMLDETPRHFH
jgi:hypothetical protein